MFNWVKIGVVTALTVLGTQLYAQKQLSLDEALGVAKNEAFALKNAGYTAEFIQEDIKGAWKQILYPTGASSWSMNRDLRHIVSFTAGIDWTFGRVAALKYHKNRLESHKVNTSFTDAAVERDVRITYFRAKTNVNMMAMYEEKRATITNITYLTQDSLMKDALELILSTQVEEVNNLIRQHGYSFDTNIEELYSLMNVDRPDDSVVLTSSFEPTVLIENGEEFIVRLQEHARTLHFQNIDRNVENKDLEKQMALGRALPALTFGYRWFYDDFTDASDNSLFIGLNFPLVNKGQTRKAINKAAIGQQKILDQADYQKRRINVTVRKEFNEWQEKLNGIPTQQAINNAQDIYERLLANALNYVPSNETDAMKTAQSLSEALTTYYNLQETRHVQILQSYIQEMKLRQTHKEYQVPVFEIGQH